MKEYLDIVKAILRRGNHKPNRTNVDTLSLFNQQAVYDLSEGFPLLTTKKMAGKRWESLIYEFLWYISGEVHVNDLREHTSIWNPWTDTDGYLDSAVGRFWRKYPVPDTTIENEAWVTGDNEQWVSDDGSFDQLRYLIDQLNENPESRRLVVTAWHPANAAASGLPPCDYTFVCNVQDNQLNIHLTQRSADIGLGVPFDVARYALLAEILALQSGLTLGKLAHTLVDAHIYCGSGDRGEFYNANQPELRHRLSQVDDADEYIDVKEWIDNTAPNAGVPKQDHVPGLLEQLAREPKPRPKIRIANKDIDALKFEDFELVNYECHPSIDLEIAK